MKTFSIIILVLIFILAIIYFIFGYNSFTFTADIDGSAFKADRGGAIYTSGRLTISALHAAPDTTQVMIVFNTTKVGTYLLNNNIQGTGTYALFSIGKKIFASSSIYTGKVTITKLDVEEKKVSGSFSFQAIQVVPQGPRIVNVTNGAFEDIPIR